MTLEFCSFASSSSGNCYLVRSENTTLLLDVGVAGKHILSGLAEKGASVEGIDGILLTHEHIDHVKSLRMMSRKAINAGVYASKGTLSQVCDKISDEVMRPVTAQQPFSIGDIEVRPFSLSHDAAEPLSYSFCKDGRQITVVTDTGCMTEDAFDQLKEADVLVLESNHEVNILKMGAYPYSVKRRILGDEGHLSNETAGKCLCEILKHRKAQGRTEVPKVVLAHLSKENNTPGQAYLTIRNVLFEEDFYIDKDLELDIALRDEIGKSVEI
ncbi:MAG: MBL fold metallo-hydrolase [Firmicutes bacterium]|nr:MBL fold metallo-hydrolase [Bacillota bacterium]